LARRLAPVGQIQQTDFLVRCHINHEKDVSITIFPDGRTLVQGTSDISRARALVSRYIGA
jgi:adenylyltransferase/sulfurtransferase